MSLQLVAKHLASKGRGPDTTLVHMTPGEVSGLHALAKAGGTALTTNPDTGLPEAGVLSRLLPTLIGAGITAATGGAAAPWMIGAGVGGLQALRTGDIGQGLMAGLGAYGGAGLTSNLADMGATALAQGAGAAVPQTIVDAFGQTVANPAYTGASAAAPVAGFGDKLAAGAKTWDWNKPMDFVSGLGGGSKGKGIGMLAGAFAPSVMAALEPNQYAPQQMVSDSRRAPGLVYRGGNVYDRMTPEQEAERKAKYNFAEGGGVSSPAAWKTDTPEYEDLYLGRDFGKERTYAATQPVVKPTVKPVVVPVVPTDEGGSNGGGSEGAGGSGGYSGGFPGATNINGVSGPTTGIASGMNSLAAILGNLGLTSLSDSIAKNVDPNYSHEGRPGATTPTGSSMTLGPDGLVDIATPTAAQSQARADAVQYGSPTLGSGILGGDKGGGYDGGRGGGGYGANNDGGGGYGPQANGGMVGQYAQGGGIGSLGSYSDGGRLLRGPGDGVSDHIPATIGRGKQPARLADGEFVVPARIVSELGNGSTEAGARALYAMMDRIQKNRRKTVGKGKVAVNSKSTRLLPA